LNRPYKVKACALLQFAQERENILSLPHAKALKEGLHELRGKQVRIFSMFQPGRRLVLLDGMLKKRGDIPPSIVKQLRTIQETINAGEKENKL
jgi:hypothetical protein